jgi:TolA-binding protein
LQNRVEAVAAFNEVVNDYPDSDAAAPARAELQRLR